MRTIMCFLCCLLLACVWPLQARGTSVKDMVLANERRFSELQIQRKCEEAAQFLAEDFQGTGGPNDSKSDFLNTCRTGGLITTAEKFSNVEVRLNAPNTAVVAYLEDGDFILNNKPIKAHMRVDSVWVKHGSKWLMHLHTSSSVPFAVTEEGKLKLLYFDSTEQHDEGAGQKETAAKDSSKVEAQSNLTIVHLEPGTRLTPFEQTLLDNEKETCDRSIRRDWSGWEGLISDDALAVYSDGYATKADVLEAIKTMIGGHCVMDKVKFTAISKKAGLITYRMTQDWNEAGKPQARQYYISSLWVNRGGKWISSFWQETDTTPQLQVAKSEDREKDAEKELLQLEKDFATATLKHDRAFSDRILADDWINVHEDGSVGTKQGDAAHKSEYDTATFDDIKVRVYGESAVTVGNYSVGWTEGGRHSAVSGRFTDVWMKRNGRWQIVSSQNTPIPETNAAEFPPDSFFIAKEKEDWEALKHKDKAAATRLLADDFVGMYDFGFFNKSEWVKQMDDQYTLDDYTIEGPKVLHPSPTTALLLYTSTCKGTGTWAEDCFHTSRVSDLLVERNGQWLSLFSQDTAATSGESDDAVQNAILSSERQIVDALSSDDIEGFGKFLPDDIVDIDTDGVKGKSEWLKGFESQKKVGYLFRGFRFEDPKLIRLGPDAA
jgi:hypothetical protein